MIYITLPIYASKHGEVRTRCHRPECWVRFVNGTCHFHLVLRNASYYVKECDSLVKRHFSTPLV